jgi:hypothetical protein
MAGLFSFTGMQLQECSNTPIRKMKGAAFREQLLGASQRSKIPSPNAGNLEVAFRRL